MTTQFRRATRRVGTAGIVTVVCAIVAIGMWAGSEQSGRAAAKKVTAITQGQLRKSCPRNQINSAWQVVRAITNPSLADRAVYISTARNYFAIKNCDATYADGYTGPPVYLSQKLSDCFTEITREHKWLVEPHSPSARGLVLTTDPDRLETICRGVHLKLVS